MTCPKSFDSKLRCAVTFVALFALEGCGMTKAYEGSSRGRSEVAVIQPAALFHGKASVGRVDDTSVGFFDDSAEVLAGKHVVTIVFKPNNNSTAQGDVEFVAKGGKVYECHGSTTGLFPPLLWFWITDAADESVVGGKAPPSK
jgi:hypothetical protein